MSSEKRVDVLAVIDAQIAITARPHEAGLHVARAAVAELIDAAAYALRTKDDAGALNDTAGHNLRAALANIGQTP